MGIWADKNVQCSEIMKPSWKCHIKWLLNKTRPSGLMMRFYLHQNILILSKRTGYWCNTRPNGLMMQYSLRQNILILSKCNGVTQSSVYYKQDPQHFIFFFKYANDKIGIGETITKVNISIKSSHDN